MNSEKNNKMELMSRKREGVERNDEGNGFEIMLPSCIRHASYPTHRQTNCSSL